MREVEGWVPDFCPFCRWLTWHRLVACVPAVLHLARGGALRHETECGDCGAERETDRARFGDVEEEPADTIDDATARTLEAEFGERLEVERRVRAGRLTNEERRRLVRKAVGEVLKLSMRQERRAGVPEVRTPFTWVLLVGAWVLTLVAGLLVQRLTAVAGPVLAVVVMMIGMATLAYFYRARRRHFHRHTLADLLVRALRPLQPTREEVESALKSQKHSGLAEAVGVERVWAGISGSDP